MRTTDPLKHDEKKREILAAAIRCILREGLQGASVSKICAEANVSAGNLYHYFEGKEQIVQAMAEIYLQSVQQSMKEAPGQGDIDRFMVAELHRENALGEVRDCMLVLDLIAEAKRSPKIAKILQANTVAIRALVTDLIERGQRNGTLDPKLDPSTTALLLITMLDAVHIARVRDPQIDMAAIRDAFAVTVRRLVTYRRPAKRLPRRRTELSRRRKQS